MNGYRSRAIVEYYDKHNTILNIWYQEYKCIPLICVDEAECCDVDTDCKILKATIPNHLTFKDGLLGIQVMLIDRKTSIDYVKPNMLQYYGHNKYTKGKRYYTKINNAIYIYLPKYDLLDVISVRLIATNPMEVPNNCVDCVYDVDKEIYPIQDEAVMQYIIPSIVNDIRNGMGIPKDNTNNANTSIGQAPSQIEQPKQ
jgi:hypothetical protein